ncbi:MAG: BlaI/MecI/CopY family transcriptional regulator [Bacteroidales bacterium]|nr:BlaI/MecI/CopY family transcriptional regulator [Bacteroidales bacterium]
MKRLTKREEEVMQVIWDLKKALVNDIISKLAAPDLPYTTISSIVRILEKKGFVDYKSYGKTHEYFPVISREEYRKTQMKTFVKTYFDSSYKNVVSYFAENEEIGLEDLKEIIKLIESGNPNTDDK